MLSIIPNKVLANLTNIHKLLDIGNNLIKNKKRSNKINQDNQNNQNKQPRKEENKTENK